LICLLATFLAILMTLALVRGAALNAGLTTATARAAMAMMATPRPTRERSMG
jgi:hypothetical protein